MLEPDFCFSKTTPPLSRSYNMIWLSFNCMSKLCSKNGHRHSLTFKNLIKNVVCPRPKYNYAPTIRLRAKIYRNRFHARITPFKFDGVFQEDFFTNFVWAEHKDRIQRFLYCIIIFGVTC